MNSSTQPCIYLSNNQPEAIITVNNDGKGLSASRDNGSSAATAVSHTDSNDSLPNKDAKETTLGKQQPTIWSPEKRQSATAPPDHIVVQREWTVSKGSRKSDGRSNHPWDRLPEQTEQPF